MGIKSFAEMERQGLLGYRQPRPPTQHSLYGATAQVHDHNVDTPASPQPTREVDDIYEDSSRLFVGKQHKESHSSASVSHKTVLMGISSVLFLVLLVGEAIRWPQSINHHRQQQLSCVWTTVRCPQDESTSSCWIRPSEYETCLRRIPLNVDHFVQSIEALDATLQQWYPFYYGPKHKVKVNPEQEGINYQVYKQDVDIHEALQDAINDVQAYGASVASIWDVSEIFNWLRDAHLNALQGNLGNLTSEFWSGWFHMAVFPEDTWNAMAHSGGDRAGTTGTTTSGDGSIHLKTVFYYDSYDVDVHPLDDVDALRLNIERHDSQGNLVETRRVLRIDNLSPGEFLVRFAKDVPLRNLALRSVGPRINALMGQYFPSVRSHTSLLSLFRLERIRPRNIFPSDSFVVDYADETSETFHVAIAVPDDDMQALLLNQSKSLDVASAPVGPLHIDLHEIGRRVNQPSCLYKNFHDGLSAAGYSSRDLVGDNGGRRSLLREPEAATDTSDEPEGRKVLKETCSIQHDCGWFTKAYNCSKPFLSPNDEGGPLQMAYKVMNETIAFKLGSFDAPPSIIFPLWREINQVATEHGIHKLMIDISDNGGGEVPLGLNLAQLMYPEVDCKMFKNKYDTPYNKPMAIWAKTVVPLMEQLEDKWERMPESQKRSMGRHLTMYQRREIVRRSQAMCADRKLDHCGDTNYSSDNCSLLTSALRVQDNSSPNSFVKFVDIFMGFMKEFNPFTVLDAFGVPQDIGERSHIRGGKIANFTNFLRHEPDYPNWWDCSPLNESNVFSEYVLVSNGNSGGTANTFQTTVEQIWKHKEISGAERPLMTVSYGGLGEKTPMSQYAGGTVDSHVNTEISNAALIGLPILYSMLSDLFSTKQRESLVQSHKELRRTLPPVPYYFRQFSQLPAIEIYNKFLWDSGEPAPLEFIYFPPDVHIRDVYTASIFDNAESLEALYQQAARFFRGP